MVVDHLSCLILYFCWLTTRCSCSTQRKKKSDVHFKLKCLTDITAFWNETDEISNRKVHLLYTVEIKFQQATFTVLIQMQISFIFFFLFIWQLLKIWELYSHSFTVLLLVHSLPPAALDASVWFQCTVVTNWRQFQILLLIILVYNTGILTSIFEMAKVKQCDKWLKIHTAIVTYLKEVEEAFLQCNVNGQL